METLYNFQTPVYRSIPDLLETDTDQLSFREKHRVRIFDQFEPITDADLYPTESQPLIDRSCQTTPVLLPQLVAPAPPSKPVKRVTKQRSATWQWPNLKANDTFRVIKRVREAQAENTYGFAYYNELTQTELEVNSPSASSRQVRRVNPSRQNARTAGTRLVPLEGPSGLQMEVIQSDSRTNWEALMHHINESIRDTNQQRMIGQYMIQKLKREQTIANLPAEQVELNKRCLEKLIQKYGTGLEAIVAKEREFERLIEAYQIFMRGDKKKTGKKKTETPKRQRKVKDGEEPLPAIGDLKAGRSQVGCKIRQDLRKEYGERIRKDLTTKGVVKPVRVPLVQQPGSAPRPIQVRVRRSVLSSNIDHQKYEDIVSDDELPPTPRSDEGKDGIQYIESQLSVTYVPSEGSIQDEGDDASGIVEIKEDEEETVLQVEEDEEKSSKVALSSDECLVLEGDTDSDVLVVNSTTELIPTDPARTPNFTILEESPIEDKETKEEAPVAEDKEHVTEEPSLTALEAVLDDIPAEETLPVEVATTETTEEKDEEMVEGEGEEETFQVAAVMLVSDVLERLDVEVEDELEGVLDDIEQVRSLDNDSINDELHLPISVDEEAETEGEPKRERSVHFKSSPEISYYEKLSPELELVPDHQVSGDLSTAEKELDDEAKALYHKVLSKIDPAELTPERVEGEDPVVTAAIAPTDAAIPPTGAADEIQQNSPIAIAARELTEEILRKIDTPTPPTAESAPNADSAAVEEAYTNAAIELTSEIFKNIESTSQISNS